MTPWAVAHQASVLMGFSRQEYWSGLPFSTPGDLPNPGIELASPALAGRFFTTVPPGKPNNHSRDSPGGIVHETLPANAGDASSIPGPGAFHKRQSN